MGDTNMDTDNPIILRRTKNSPTIICSQRKAEKIIPTEQSIIESNKLAFNDDIGTVTNRVTTMIEIQSNNNLTKEQYDELSYRIKCGQHFQQCTIDRAKGIIAKPMPEEWYNPRANKVKPEDSDDIKKQKDFDMSIVADKKPYFMTYVYPHLKNEYNDFVKSANFKSLSYFKKEIKELLESDNLTEKEEEFMYYYHRLLPVGYNPCVVNRISWIFEKEFNGYLKEINKASSFDYKILKSNTPYSKSNYNQIVALYRNYMMRMDRLHKKARLERFDDIGYERQKIINAFEMECEVICTNEEELCNIVLDICYTKEGSKQFAWDVCGKQIVKNLLDRKRNKLSFPELSNDNYNFKYNGESFIMKEVEINDI